MHLHSDFKLAKTQMTPRDLMDAYMNTKNEKAVHPSVGH